MKKRIISMLLVLSMVLAMVPAQVFAANTDQEATQVKMEENRFTDIEKGQWYYDYVTYVVENNLFSGISSTEFDPMGTMTRAMYVTVMGRIAEIDPDDYPQSGFEDVSNDNWASPYVAWAKEKGIASGVGDGKFAPEAFVTREQMAVFTVRFFESYGISLPEATIDTQPKDLDSVSDFAKEASLKLWACGLFQGNESGNFNPLSNTTRVEAAAFLSRTDEKVEAWFIETGVKEDSEPTSSGHRQKYYTYRFVSNGGANIPDRNIAKGSTLDNLPIPYKADAVFVGWYYDKELSQLVERTDVATGSATLYAKYEDTTPLTETERVPVAVSIDSQPDFTLTIVATETLTIDQLETMVQMENLSSQQDKEWFKITQSGNEFVISGYNYPLGEERQDGFVEGYAYKITLLDDGLSFKDQDSTSRVYDFTIQRAEVMNLELSDKVTEIPYADISDLTVNGEPSDSVFAPISIDADGNSTSNTELEGTFTYEKGDLEAGDTVAIYEGDTAPSQRDDGVITADKTSFVTIIEKEGNQYTYKVAETKDVLFTPDVFPVKVGADTDENPDTITVNKSEMTYIDEIYAEVGLNGETTIDVGDFMAFYEGASPSDSATTTNTAIYAEILSVEVDGDNYVIGYEVVTLAEMQTAMDVSKRGSVEGDILLSDANVVALEDDIARQAQESGFVDDAVMYLAALAMETDSFDEVSDQYQLKTFEMQQNGQPITSETLQLMAGGSKPSISVSMPKVSISRTLKHFTNMPDYMKGVSATLEVAGAITFKFGPDNDNVVKIDLKGEFEQEISVAFAAEANTDWDFKWGFLPWITACEITAGLEFYNYTRIDVKANITTQEAGSTLDKIKIEDISDKVKDLLSQEGGDESKTVADGLAEQYAAMLENESSWVDIIDKEILKLSFNILYVVDIQVKASFVVAADMNIALGASFTYENAKRYIYYIDVFEASVTNNVIDLCPEHYVFEFYVMGALGLRAGIRLEFALGIFSCDIASVGFGAEVGAYVRVWGYFYYKLEVTKAVGKPEEKETQYSGALLFELGIYLKITFRAAVGGGKMSYTPTLFEDEWPLWTAGHQDNVIDFAYSQEEAPTVNLKHYFKVSQFPDDLFEMSYLDLKEGLDYDGTLFEAVYDSDENFTINITNPAFTYDSASNLIKVEPSQDASVEEGEMIITWKDRPLAFSSAPIQRTIPLHWDSIRDGYAIAPHTNGGSYVPIIVKEFEETVVAPQDPTRSGYVFKGWFDDEAMTSPYAFPQTMPAENVDIYAKWEANTDTDYTVRHYIQELGKSQYKLQETEQCKGTTNAVVTPGVKTYTGYIAPDEKETTILADGSRVVDYYYDLQRHTVTFNMGEIGGEPMVRTLIYGATVTAPVLAKEGYTFKGWGVPELATTMGTEPLEYTAQWEKLPTKYRVEYHVMNTEGKYECLQILTRETRADSITPTWEDVKGYNDKKYDVDGVTELVDVTVNGTTIYRGDPVFIRDDGSTVIKAYYERSKQTVIFYPENGEAFIEQLLYVGSKLVPPTLVNEGYILTGFNPELPETVDKDYAQYTAQWAAGVGTTYTVKHYRQNLDGSYPTAGELVEVEVKADGTTGGTTTAEAKEYTGFTSPTTVAQETISGNGETVVTIQYTRNSYPVTWNVDDVTTVQQVKYGAVIAPPAEEPTKDGFYFARWRDVDSEEELTSNTQMDTAPRTFKAEWRTQSNQYTLSYAFALEDGTPLPDLEVPDSTTITYGESYGAFPEINTPGYQLVGWKEPEGGYSGYVEEGYGVLERNYTLTAVLKPQKYTVRWYYFATDEGTYNPNGSYDPKGQLAYGEEFTLPVQTEAAKLGYLHTGWKIDGTDVVLSTSIPEAMVRTVPDHDMTFVGIWTPIDFSIAFDTVGGTAVDSVTRCYDDETILEEEVETPPTKEGYDFVGWMLDGELVDEIQYERDLVLTAKWDPKEYNITYVGASSLRNPDHYTPDSEPIIIVPSSKTYNDKGKRFVGWYTDPAFEHEVKEGEIAIPTGTIGDITFYSKWETVEVTVVFDDNTGLGNTHEQTFSSDTLNNFIDSNPFTYEGATFDYWSTEPDGTGDRYENREIILGWNVYELVGKTLYAQWTLKDSSIIYRNVSVGAEGNEDNRTSFTIEDSFDLVPPTGIQGKFKFEGWYNADGDKVEFIPKNTSRGMVLTAKWSHPGEFSIAFDRWESTNLTFHIVRTIPEGAVASENPQRVYYRSINGTMVGSVVEDVAQFYHVGGPDACVEFTKDDTEDYQEVTVTQIRKYAPYTYNGTTYVASQFTDADTRRTMGIQIYKIVNPDSTNPQEIADIAGDGVYMGGFYPGYDMSYDFYTQFDENSYGDGQGAIVRQDSNQGGYGVNMSSKWYSVGNSVSYPDVREYIKATAGPNDLAVNVGFSGYTTNPAFKPELYFYVDGKLQDKVMKTLTTVHTPYMIEKTGLPTDWNEIKTLFDGVGGSASDEAVVARMKYYFKIIDTRAPVQVGLAPMAFGTYAEGDAIYLSVIYDEIIAEVGDVTLNEIPGLSLKDVEYRSGEGTNVLVFKATVTETYEVDNDTLTATKPVRGTVEDACGNQAE